MLSTILLKMVVDLLMMVAGLAMPSGAQNENQQQASDSIFKSVAMHEVKVILPSKPRMNGDFQPKKFSYGGVDTAKLRFHPIVSKEF